MTVISRKPYCLYRRFLRTDHNGIRIDPLVSLGTIPPEVQMNTTVPDVPQIPRRLSIIFSISAIVALLGVSTLYIFADHLSGKNLTFLGVGTAIALGVAFMSYNAVTELQRRWQIAREAEREAELKVRRIASHLQ